MELEEWLLEDLPNYAVHRGQMKRSGQTVENLLAMAALVAYKTPAIENNFHSTVLTLVGMWREGTRREDKDSVVNWSEMHADKVMPRIEESAECGLMQLGFLERGLNVPSTFIMKAYRDGWRYKGGFYKVES
jgi:hypothetical protein